MYRRLWGQGRRGALVVSKNGWYYDIVRFYFATFCLLSGVAMSGQLVWVVDCENSRPGALIEMLLVSCVISKKAFIAATYNDFFVFDNLLVMRLIDSGADLGHSSLWKAGFYDMTVEEWTLASTFVSWLL